MQRQSALGSRKIHRVPEYNTTHIGRVTKTDNYDDIGRIEVMFLDYGVSHPIWVVGSVERKPVIGDLVIVGYINGRKDSPYLAGFVKNGAYTTNFITIQENRIKIQLPLVDSEQDVKSYLNDDGRQDDRAYVLIDENGLDRKSVV
jgi:hypothetical protein